MATYKKQLKNRAGDNIIPVVNDIHTEQIADEAITSDKLDWSSVMSEGKVGLVATCYLGTQSIGSGFQGRGFNTCDISNSAYASRYMNGSVYWVELQPGAYLCLIRGRLSDDSGSNRLMVGIQDSSTSASDTLGVWTYNNTRYAFSVAVPFVVTSSSKKFYAMFYSQDKTSLTSIGSNTYLFFRIGDVSSPV